MSQPDERPVLEETDLDWRPFLDSELSAQWEELRATAGMETLVELIEDCFGPQPWRRVSEDYRALIFLLAFHHQPGEQWASWLHWLSEHLRTRRRYICARSNGGDSPIRRS